ncbi:MAG: Holliday junction branch migration protein RuvA [Planctomycetota bacterium]|nr:Holliday junction branch migration protein RuvA [Planctomycetota bacterium]
MITRIKGKLIDVHSCEAILEVGALTYALLIPAADIPTLQSKIGSDVEFHTIHYLESQSQGTSFAPRLIGFSNETNRSFFVLFTTVKGIGNRKALRALIRPFNETAAAIAQRDVSSLTDLPEIGKRSAETIIAALHGKVDEFAGQVASVIESNTSPLYSDAIEMLMQLGESRKDARQLVSKVIAMEPEIDSADQIVQATFQLKGKT